MTQQKKNRSLRTEAIARHAMLTALSTLLLAATAGQASEDEPPEYSLSVRPSICVSYDSAEPCSMSMQVSWESDATADVCLRDTLETPMLHCWENSDGGSVAIDYENNVDVRYQLVEESSLGVLAEAEVKVINRDLRDSRKRRRHVWSIL